MTLQDLQQDAYVIAEAKGHHESLEPGATLDRRLLALAELALVYRSITAMTQEIKRHGLTNEAFIAQLTLDAFETLSEFRAQMNAYNECAQTSGEHAFGCVSEGLATTVRLVLTHTEIDEAGEEVHDTEKLGKELADILIRTAELAQHHGIDLGTATRAVMFANQARPKFYGTPHAENHTP